MNQHDKENLTKRKQDLSNILTEQMKLSKPLRDQRLINQTKKMIQTVDGWIHPKKAEKLAQDKLPKPQKPEDQRIPIPVSLPPTTEAEPSNLTIEEKVKLAADSGGIMIISDLETLDKVWPLIKTSGIQVAGPDFIKAAAKKKIREELRPDFFKSNKPNNLEYWGVKQDGEKIHNFIYCPYNRKAQALAFVEEGLGMSKADFKEFDIRFLNI